MNNLEYMEKVVNCIRSEEFLNRPLDEIEKTICSFGLNDEVLNEQPITLSEYYGKGIKIWQYPKQFAKLLLRLKDLKIDSYTEIGCRWGGSFIVISEVLKKNNPNIILSACDLIEESQILRDYRNFSDFSYHEKSSRDDSMRKVFLDSEMLFIDGDHSYEGCKYDWEMVRNNERTKYIIFHDIDSYICTGVVQVWSEIKNNKNFKSEEIIDKYPLELIPSRQNYLGIGILERL